MRSMIDAFLNPGVRLVVAHNVSHQLYNMRLLRWLGLIIWNLEVLFSSCHISVKCKIPKTTVFPHPVGIVIGDGVLIGDDVVIYQNVTLGIARVGLDEYPVIDNGTVIYAGAVIVGAYYSKKNSKIPALQFIKG